MTEKFELKPEQARVLEELEKILGKTIPLKEEIKWDIFGVKIEEDNVIGLSLYNEGLTTLPESIGDLKSLQVLKLRYNKLSTLPESIGNLTSLIELDSSYNKLSALPESISNLKSLQTLELIDNNLMTLPEFIGNLSSLKKLSLKQTRLSTLPESIGNLTSLTELDLSYNKLSTLPESISNLKSLQTLDISTNRFKTLPELIANLKSLKELNLNVIQLSTLPEFICNLSSLKKLELSTNKISTLPELIGNLTSLEYLNLDSNQLTTLPESIGDLKSLQTLSLWFNKVKTLPKSIGNLSSLQILYLNDNHLSKLPESFSQLRNLQEVRFWDNDWKGEWKEISKNDIPKILKLCRKLHGIIVFISHAMRDEKTYRILELSEFLDENVIIQEEGMDMNIIHDAIICEEDLVEDIWEFMTENVPKTHLLVFIATKNSIASEACRYELFLANKYEIEILPIKGTDISWENLKQIDLIDRNKESQGFLDLSTPKERFEFNENKFEEICEKLSQYINTHEFELKLRKEKIEIVDDMKNALIDSIRSKEFKDVIKDNLEEFDRIFQELSNKKITRLDYCVKLGKILSKRKEN
ncbi:MAG: leucine-rich repeat domain-containing protein [Promethearchaeota archaeon]